MPDARSSSSRRARRWASSQCTRKNGAPTRMPARPSARVVACPHRALPPQAMERPSEIAPQITTSRLMNATRYRYTRRTVSMRPHFTYYLLSGNLGRQRRGRVPIEPPEGIRQRDDLPCAALPDQVRPVGGGIPPIDDAPAAILGGQVHPGFPIREHLRLAHLQRARGGV